MTCYEQSIYTYKLNLGTPTDQLAAMAKVWSSKQECIPWWDCAFREHFSPSSHNRTAPPGQPYRLPQSLDPLEEGEVATA